MNQFLTVDQAAKRLQAHPGTIRRQLRAGVLQGIKRGGEWRVPEEALSSTVAQIETIFEQQLRISAERMAPIYAQSLSTSGELTAITSAGGDIHTWGVTE